MKKRPIAAIVNTSLTGGANLWDDTTAKHWGWVKDSNKTRLLGPYPYGKVKRVDIIDPVAETLQVVSIDCGTTKETIVASTRYRIEIGNPEADYETQGQVPTKVAFTSAATLSGNADTDRANVYTQLVSRINAYGGSNCTAYNVYVTDYTSGGATGNATPVIMQSATQQTSSVTAKFLKWTVTSGTFGAGSAAGKVWFYDVSDMTACLTTAVTWTYGTTTLTQTNGTGVKNTGIAIVDNAGYFTSNLQRGGANFVGLTQGFKTVVATVEQSPVYSIGIGTDMLNQLAKFNYEKNDAISGSLEYVFEEGSLPVAGNTYTKFVVTYLRGDENALAGEPQEVEHQEVMYMNYAASDLSTLKSNIATYAAK